MHSVSTTHILILILNAQIATISKIIIYKKKNYIYRSNTNITEYFFKSDSYITHHQKYIAVEFGNTRK